MIAVWILLFAAAVVLLGAYVAFRMAFHAEKEVEEEFPLPPGKIYEPYHGQMVEWIRETRALPHEDVSIRSFDGLELWATYYEYRPGAPVELMFHGYRGNADRDLCGGVQRCFALERNVLVVDQRTSRRSEGKVISFGINERRDCLAWVDFLIEKLGGDVKIILTGISMGAATVLMAAGEELPPNVVGVLADCGYSSPRAIIRKVIGQMKLPLALYPLVRLGGRLYGGFDLEAFSPLEAVKKCRVPVIFFHGEEDNFVPCQMSRELCEACAAPKMLITVPGAGHGMSYLLDREGYLAALREFDKMCGL